MDRTAYLCSPQNDTHQLPSPTVSSTNVQVLAPLLQKSSQGIEKWIEWHVYLLQWKALTNYHSLQAHMEIYKHFSHCCKRTVQALVYGFEDRFIFSSERHSPTIIPYQLSCIKTSINAIAAEELFRHEYMDLKTDLTSPVTSTYQLPSPTVPLTEKQAPSLLLQKSS